MCAFPNLIIIIIIIIIIITISISIYHINAGYLRLYT